MKGRWDETVGPRPRSFSRPDRTGTSKIELSSDEDGTRTRFIKGEDGTETGENETRMGQGRDGDEFFSKSLGMMSSILRSSHIPLVGIELLGLVLGLGKG